MAEYGMERGVLKELSIFFITVVNEKKKKLLVKSPQKGIISISCRSIYCFRGIVLVLMAHTTLPFWF